MPARLVEEGLGPVRGCGHAKAQPESVSGDVLVGHYASRRLRT
jgi:hypothetical protein